LPTVWLRRGKQTWEIVRRQPGAALGPAAPQIAVNSTLDRNKKPHHRKDSTETVVGRGPLPCPIDAAGRPQAQAAPGPTLQAVMLLRFLGLQDSVRKRPKPPPSPVTPIAAPGSAAPFPPVRYGSAVMDRADSATQRFLAHGLYRPLTKERPSQTWGSCRTPERPTSPLFGDGVIVLELTIHHRAADL
jgi:hypothetical protein